jgi:hypothetical protein
MARRKAVGMLRRSGPAQNEVIVRAGRMRAETTNRRRGSTLVAGREPVDAGLCGPADVAMVQTADFRKLHDRAHLRPLTALITTFRNAMTDEMVDELVGMVNELLRVPNEPVTRDAGRVEEERRGIEAELTNLVAFVAKGDDTSPRLREEIRSREQRLVELDEEVTRLRQAVTPVPIRIHRTWVRDHLQRLTDLLATDPPGARRELGRHVDDLRLTPAPEAGQRVIRVTGRAKLDGLLGSQEAVRLQLVGGADLDCRSDQPSILTFGFVTSGLEPVFQL